MNTGVFHLSSHWFLTRETIPSTETEIVAQTIGIGGNEAQANPQAAFDPFRARGTHSNNVADRNKPADWGTTRSGILRPSVPCGIPPAWHPARQDARWFQKIQPGQRNHPQEATKSRARRKTGDWQSRDSAFRHGQWKQDRDQRQSLG